MALVAFLEGHSTLVVLAGASNGLRASNVPPLDAACGLWWELQASSRQPKRDGSPKARREVPSLTATLGPISGTTHSHLRAYVERAIHMSFAVVICYADIYI